MLELRGPNLTLRYPEPSDAPALLHIANDPEVTRWFSWGPYATEAEPAAFISATLPKRDAGVALDFVAVDEQSQVLGVVTLSELSPRDRRATLGAWIGREFWETEVETEMLGIAAAFAFEHLGYIRLNGWSRTPDTRSRRLYLRCGFRQEGTLRSFHVSGGEAHDVVLFALQRREWERSTVRKFRCSVVGSAPQAWILGHATVGQADAADAAGQRIVVFLCHASGDKPTVRDLDRRLRRDGFTPWLDERDLVAGEDWEAAIRRALRRADAVAVCVSARSTTKTGFVQKEIRQVLDLADEQPEDAIFVIPIRLEDCEVPDRLRRWHWIDLYRRGGYNRLRDSLLSLPSRQNQ